MKGSRALTRTYVRTDWDGDVTVFFGAEGVTQRRGRRRESIAGISIIKGRAKQVCVEVKQAQEISRPYKLSLGRPGSCSKTKTSFSAGIGAICWAQAAPVLFLASVGLFAAIWR